MTHVTSAIILAGGLGTRLRGVVPDLPKPMAPINGRPFLEYQIDYWIGQGIGRFVLSVGYQREIILAHFDSTYRGAVIDYAIEENPLGTGGGLLLALDKVDHDKTFLLLNGDTFFEVNLADLSQFHAANQSEWTFSLFRANESGRYMGMDLDADSQILSLQSGTGQPGRLANGGVYLIEPHVLRALIFKAGQKLSLEDDILPVVFSAGVRFFGYECAGRFIDIGVPEDYSRATDLLTA